MLFIAISVKEEGKLVELAKQVEATKEVMAMNIEKLLDRGEALDTLEYKAEELLLSRRFSLAEPHTQSTAGSVWQKSPDTSPDSVSLQTLAAKSPAYSPASPAYSSFSPVSSSSYSLLATASEKQMIQQLGETEDKLKSLFDEISVSVNEQEEQLDQVSLEDDVCSLLLEDMLSDVTVATIAGPTKRKSSKSEMPPLPPLKAPMPPPPPPEVMRPLARARMSAAVGRGAGAPHRPPMAPVPAHPVPPPPPSQRLLHTNAFQRAPPVPQKIPAGGLFGQAVNKSGAPPLPPKAAGFAYGSIPFRAFPAASSSTSSMLPQRGPPAPAPAPPRGVMFKHAAPAPVPLGGKLGGKGYAGTVKKPASRESLLSSIHVGAALKKTPAPEVCQNCFIVLYFC